MSNNNIKLHECFMQFKVRVTGKSFSKKSDAIINGASDNFNASADKITGSIKILQSRELRDLKNAEQAIRLFIATNTMRLGDYYVISPQLYVERKQKLNELVENHQKAKTAFIDKIGEIQQNDSRPKPDGLGDLYNPANYPTKQQVEESFGITVTIAPLPDFNQFNVKGLGGTEAADLLNKLNTTVDNDIKQLQYDLLHKLIKGKNPDTNSGMGNGLLYAISKIKDYDEENTFRQATIDNVLEIADIVDSLNAIGNPDIARLAQSIRDMFTVDADSLKDNDNDRNLFVEKAMKELEEIQDTMEGFV